MSRTISIEQAARELGIGRSLAYDLARNGELPVIRLGRILRVPRARLAKMLGETNELGDGNDGAVKV